jgi:hypothetical protein
MIGVPIGAFRCHTGAGGGAALRTHRRAFRSIPKRYLQLSGTTAEALVNPTRVTSQLIRRMCVADLAVHTEALRQFW